MSDNKGIILKDSYPFDCAYCGHGQRANPSLGMQVGMWNHGGGRCLECGEYNILEIDIKTNEKMKAKKREDWEKELKEE